jgi:hypothetical protein
MSIPHSHLHTKKRSYFGEFDSRALLDWLNDTKNRPAGDLVEKLIRLHDEFLKGHLGAEERIRTFVARVVRRTKLAVAPVVGTITVKRWDCDWKMVGDMDASQGLAFIRALHLADRGLLNRIRECGREKCSRWFYAKFPHQRFCSLSCQQRAFRDDPEWRRKHSEDVKRARHEARLLEKLTLRRGR